MQTSVNDLTPSPKCSDYKVRTRKISEFHLQNCKTSASSNRTYLNCASELYRGPRKREVCSSVKCYQVSPSHCWNVKCCSCKLSLYRACTIITSPSSYKAVGLESELCVARLKFSSLQFSGAAVERTKPPFSRQCFPCLAEMSPSEWADTQHWEALISGWSSSLFFQTERGTAYMARESKYMAHVLAKMLSVIKCQGSGRVTIDT